MCNSLSANYLQHYYGPNSITLYFKMKKQHGFRWSDEKSLKHKNTVTEIVVHQTYSHFKGHLFPIIFIQNQLLSSYVCCITQSVLYWYYIRCNVPNQSVPRLHWAMLSGAEPKQSPQFHISILTSVVWVVSMMFERFPERTDHFFLLAAAIFGGSYLKINIKHFTIHNEIHIWKTLFVSWTTLVLMCSVFF